MWHRGKLEIVGLLKAWGGLLSDQGLVNGESRYCWLTAVTSLFENEDNFLEITLIFTFDFTSDAN